MILYIQTPSIPRSSLHNITVNTMIQYLDNCEQFTEIKWLVNIDNIKTSNTRGDTYVWEDINITKSNFENIASKLNKTTLSINISDNPCFYLAFRYLTLATMQDIENSNLSNSEYCVMWLEDDWSFIDKEQFSKNLSIFLNNSQYKCYVLHRNKINMGGNPDIIKGDVFEYFKDVNLDFNNKRDPENIRKNYVWVPKIFNNPNNSFTLSGINNNINHIGRTYQDKVLSAAVVEGEQGDEWRRQLNISKNWSYADKPGIASNRSYSYEQ